MLVLKTLEIHPRPGYGISLHIGQMSKGVFRLNPGSLFIALQRMQRAGLIQSEWKTTEKGRRAKYYTLTELGRKRLSGEVREWGRQVAAIASILEISRQQPGPIPGRSQHLPAEVSRSPKFRR